MLKYSQLIHPSLEDNFLFWMTGALWVCVVLNPHCTNTERQHWRGQLTQWSSCSVCPLEDGDSHLVSDLSINHGQIRQQRGLPFSYSANLIFSCRRKSNIYIHSIIVHCQSFSFITFTEHLLTNSWEFIQDQFNAAMITCNGQN